VGTGSDGLYRFSLVPPGTYSVSAKAEGFATLTRTGVVVSPSQTVGLDITLEVGKAATTVEVSAGAPLVSTATANLASTVDNLAILSAPLVSRSIYDLTFASPLVAQGMNLNPASGGGRESSSTYLLNGADNNDNVMNQDFNAGSNNITPPIESVSEFTLLTNDFSAQYGRGGGVVVSVEQKSGTNKLHGALYEFHRDRSLDASDFFSNRAQTSKPKYVRNQFGGEIDGPIVKDKTFFAFAYDEIALHTGSDTVTPEPTAAELAALTAGAGPIATYYLQKYPPLTATELCPAEAVNAPAAVGHIGCVHFFDPIEYPERNYFGRVEHNFSERDRLSFSANVHRYNSADEYGGGYASVHPIGFGDFEHYHNLALVETHTFSPRLVNELTIAHNRHSTITRQLGKTQNYDPGIIIDGDAYSGMGFGFGPSEGYMVYDFTQERFQFQDNATLLVGRHSIKFGGGWQYGILTRNHDEGVPGQYEFGNDLGPTPASLGVVTPNGSISNIPDPTLTNFQHDFPYFEEVSIDPRTGARADNDFRYLMNDINAFVQDDFKLNPHLTLNLGLRWDQYGAPTEHNGNLAQLINFNCLSSSTIPLQQCLADTRSGPVKSMWNTRHGDFGPRVGFAWDVFGNGRTSLRGSYGIFYDRIQDMIWSNASWNPPFYALLDSDATSGDTIYYSVPAQATPSYVPNSIPSPGHRVSLRTMENNLKDASYENFYLGVEHEFSQNMLLRVNYNGSLGRHLPVLMYYNRYDGDAYNSTLTPVFPNALYTGFNYRADNISSSYNALSVEVQKRLSKGLHFQTGYTWSHLLDYDSELFSSSTVQGGYSQQSWAFVSNAHRNLAYGNGAFDHRHSIKVLLSYELPFLRQQQGFLGKIAGGWQLSSFYQAYSGHPISVYNGRSRFAGNALDANGIPENLGGDYNLDGLNNDFPDYVGGSASAAYSHMNPADGIFKDNNPIGCGSAGANSTNIADCNAAYGVVTPSSLFVNPPGTGVRYGTLGRDVFYGPWYNELDGGLFKNFQVTERVKMQFRAEAINLPNHPDFDGVDSNLSDSTFGKAQILANAPRRIQFGLRVLF
jgi:hypothetical protein